MKTAIRPVAIAAHCAPARERKTRYPEPFATLLDGSMKRPLGELFGIRNFGVNLTTLEPGGMSSLRHAHSRQDEFVYVLSDRAVLLTEEGETELSAGMCAGFPAGTGNAHHLVNRSSDPVTFLEIGDRSPEDRVTYPDDDLEARFVDGEWRFSRKSRAANGSLRQALIGMLARECPTGPILF